MSIQYTWKFNIDTTKHLYPIIKKLLNNKLNKSNLKILDVGGGNGYLLWKLYKEGIVLDISKQALKMVVEKGLIGVIFDIDNPSFSFPFKDNTFDIVISTEVIEHLLYPDHYAREILRILKLNGIFILSTPNTAYIKNRIALLFGKAFYKRPWHIRFFTKEFLIEFLENKNKYFDIKYKNYRFKVENVTGCKSRKLGNLSIKCPSLLSSTLIVKCKVIK